MNPPTAAESGAMTAASAAPDFVRVRRAVLSVYDKTGIVEFARALTSHGVEIISTGGTLKALRDAGLAATSVEDLTGVGSMFDGRVKTLHPIMMGGILARPGHPKDRDQMREHNIAALELVVVNLYPFSRAADDPNATLAEAIELIDVGGPSMIRGAAKNHATVAVVCDPADYATITAELNDHQGQTTLATRARLAAKAFAITAAYDARIAAYLYDRFSGEEQGVFPAVYIPRFTRMASLRYGENPHQQAAIYAADEAPISLARARVHGGKELSYNNLNDLDAAWRMAADFAQPFAAIFKHASPCGAAVAGNIRDAYLAAYDTDPLSAYGGIVALNRPVDLDCARALDETTFLECILAPGFAPDALDLLKQKKTRRYVEVPTMNLREALRFRMRDVVGGLLVQSEDTAVVGAENLRVVTRKQPTPAEIESLLLGRIMVKHAKSNAIVLVRGNAAVGFGAGQTSRVDAVHQAISKAGERSKGAVLASDAFFPMADGPEAAIAAGITAIIQPGGSKRDPDVIAACDAAGIAMVFSGVRNFRH
ncbi:MAG TPA: bifunctional phosphoribosylaminoimidazolecarboxamide formyltransferase/IMP cyclohydrolase [bacterium]|nr:bifunctional phosphoribosylaminoimidazolecarboxamide formyltransferase/IMP cyclohydrolase [bacterium]